MFKSPRFVLAVVVLASITFTACDSSKEEDLEIVDLVVGEGAVAEEGQCLSVHYTGWLENGQEFDSSAGKDPFAFWLGQGDVIRGWDEGIPGMQVGGKRKLTVPPHLGYGNRGWLVGLPNDATLIFEVELLEILTAPEDTVCNRQ